MSQFIIDMLACFSHCFSYTEQDSCDGKDCGSGAVCRKGICLCDEEHQLLWGKCYRGDAWKFAVSSSKDDVKYRKPEPPKIPQYCYMDKVEMVDCEECTGKDNKRKCVMKKCKSRTNRILFPLNQ